MPIKQIQLRGISRLPSDRMTEDGGVAESLNFHVENEENAPTIAPEDITEDKEIPTNFYGDIIYIHKTPGYTNYIGISDGVVKMFSGDPLPSGINFRRDVPVIGVTAVHTSYMITVDPTWEGTVSHNDYVLWKDIYYRVDSETTTGSKVYIGDKSTYRDNTTDLCDLGDEKMMDIKSIGNTLIILGEEKTHYLLFKEGRYIGLGTSIPIPDVQFVQHDVTKRSQYEFDGSETAPDPTEVAIGDNISDVTYTAGEPLESDNTEAKYQWDYTQSASWDRIFKCEKWSKMDNSPLDECSKLLLNRVWEQTNALRSSNHRNGILTVPIYITFALRLYDGSHYAPCAPIPLGMADHITDETESNFMNILITTVRVLESSSDTSYKHGNFFCLLTLNQAYRIKAIYEDLSAKYANWKDIVLGLDIFVSEPCYPEVDREKCKIRSLGESAELPGNLRLGAFFAQYIAKGYEGRMVLDPASSFDKIEETLVSKAGPFFRIKTYDFEEFSSISSQEEYVFADFNSDSLSLGRTLGNTFMTNHEVAGSGAMTYNESLYLYDIRQEMTRGYHGMFNASFRESSFRYDYRFIYKIVSSDGQQMTVYSDVVSEATYNGYAMITYPDPRCKSVIVGVRIMNNDPWIYEEIPMKEFPNISASYAFLGLGTRLGLVEGTEVESTDLPEENRIELIKGKVFLSSMSNPFMYPEERRVTVGSGNIIGLATSTQAISTGQFGEYPVYAFTDEGIWALSLASDGTIATSRPMSRECVTSADAIKMIDNAVVFVTDRAVMMLEGGSIRSLSEYMTGQHYSLDKTSSPGVIMDTRLSSIYMDAMATDSEDTFMAFMKGSRCLYDYTGSRLIFYRSDRCYQYVYMIKTETWHKIARDAESDLKLRWTLNSYPECFVSVQDASGIAHLMDYTTPLTTSSTDEINSVVITRPFDLDNPDILKTINHVRIRGQYEKTDSTGKPRVCYILMGSQDGINFHRLGSLRGKAWKMFRIIVLSKLKPTERISWIDVEYETRFTNKLR